MLKNHLGSKQVILMQISIKSARYKTDFMLSCFAASCLFSRTGIHNIRIVKNVFAVQLFD